MGVNFPQLKIRACRQNQGVLKQNICSSFYISFVLNGKLLSSVNVALLLFSHGISQSFLTLIKRLFNHMTFLTTPNSRTNTPFSFSVNTFFYLILSSLKIHWTCPQGQLLFGKKFEKDPNSCQSLPPASRICIIFTIVSPLMLVVLKTGKHPPYYKPFWLSELIQQLLQQNVTIHVSYFALIGLPCSH